MSSKDIETLAINTIRILSAEAIQKANSGHPGMPMGCAPIAFTLYSKIMKHNPANPHWLNRDRFVLSGGHGSMLLYSILHLTGYKLSIEDIKSFRQWGSLTPGHPEYGLTDGVETTTGPLGQGFTNVIGMAIAQAYLAAMFNKDDLKILDHYIFGICGDGDMMEGISYEASSLAGHLKLNKVIMFYDSNDITIDGSTELTFTENIEMRFTSQGWFVQKITDVNNIQNILDAVENAKKSDKPNLIIAKTKIGFGSPNKQGKAESHGSPLGEEEIKLTKKNLGWEYSESFFVPNEVKEYFAVKKQEFDNYEKEWNKKFDEYKSKYPKEAEDLINYLNGNFGAEWEKNLPVFKDDGKKIATRQASSKVLNAISKYLPTLIGGSADLTPSNNTFLNDYPVFNSQNYSGRNFHFGIREHSMGSILNGMALYGGVIPYGGTFLVFSDYMRPAIRLAAYNKIRPIFILTHDSIGLGEDGPTHQPIEQLASLRTIPNIILIRPADANETSEAYRVAIKSTKSPVLISLTRQGIPILDQTKYNSATNLKFGAYIINESSKSPELILMASGSEVHLALKTQEILESKGKSVRVVSFPSWELFDQQSEEYKLSILPKYVKKRISIEAGVSQGWEKYVGESGRMISIERFGLSAPEKILFEKFGITPENIVKVAEELFNEH